MIPLILRSVDNRHRDGKFIDAMQDEITALRRENKRMKEQLRRLQSDKLLVELAR